MKNSLKRSTVKIGLSIVLLAVAFANYIQVNGDAQRPTLSIIKDANADASCVSSNTNCYLNTTADGKRHYITNAEAD